MKEMRENWEMFKSLSGVYALLLLFLSTIIFSQLYPGYNHSKQAFSEMGVVGAPNYIAFNFVSFGIVGILSLLFTFKLHSTYREVFEKKLLYFQVMAGISWILTGAIPASYTNQLMYDLHLAAAFSTYIFGSLTITFSVKLFNFIEGYDLFSLLSVLFMFVVVFSIMLSFGEPVISPEWGQLISIFSYFSWQGIYSYLLYTRQD